MVNGTGYNRNLLVDPSDPAQWVFEEIVVDERVFDKTKNYVWPLPESEVNTNKNLVQNPLW
jgi:hypothetical protein